MQNVSEIYDSLANCRNNKIFGLDLCVLQQHNNNYVYFGDFVLVSYEFDIINLIDNVDREKLQNILTDSTFNSIF